MKILVYSGPAENLPTVNRLLSDVFDVRHVPADPTLLSAQFKTCSVFLDASMKVPITRDMILGAHALKLVVTATTGANHIDSKTLQEKAIPLLTLADQKQKLHDITAAAEHSWLLLMACARKFRGALKHTENGLWDRVQFPGIMLKGKTLGLVGLGRIGTWMSRYASAFGMKVIGFDPYQDKTPIGVERASLENLFRMSDFVSLHVTLSDQTMGMITQTLLSVVKRGAILINTSRSELINENDLVQALRSGALSAVGVDVLVNEPFPDKSPLWNYAKDHENVIISPHIGGFCPEAVDIVLDISCRRILNFFQENPHD